MTSASKVTVLMLDYQGQAECCLFPDVVCTDSPGDGLDCVGRQTWTESGDTPATQTQISSLSSTQFQITKEKYFKKYLEKTYLKTSCYPSPCLGSGRLEYAALQVTSLLLTERIRNSETYHQVHQFQGSSYLSLFPRIADNWASRPSWTLSETIWRWSMGRMMTLSVTEGLLFYPDSKLSDCWDWTEDWRWWCSIVWTGLTYHRQHLHISYIIWLIFLMPIFHYQHYGNTVRITMYCLYINIS